MIYDDNGVSLFHHYLSNDLWWSARETSEPHAIRRQFSPASTFQWRDRWPGQLFVVWWPQKMHAANGYFMWFNMAITIWFAFNIAKYGKKTWQKTCMAKKHGKKHAKNPCFHVVQPRWVDRNATSWAADSESFSPKKRIEEFNQSVIQSKIIPLLKKNMF